MAENEPTNDGGDEAPSGSKRWLVMVLAVVAAAGGAAGGYVVGGLIAAPSEASAAADATQAEPSEPEYAYLEVGPVSGNLNDPRMGRVFKVTLRVKARKDVFGRVERAIGDHEPELHDWLMGYFASCTMDEVVGGQNFNRIRREIREAFNARLWPDGKPLIDDVLFKDRHFQ